MASNAKVAKVSEIKEQLGAAASIVLTDYRGLSVKEMQELRRVLSENDCEITVYKNRLTKLALAELEITELDQHLIGPTAFATSDGDPVTLAKSIVDFAKKHEALEVKAAYVESAYMDVDAVKTLAALPSRDELVAKIMGTMLNPVRGFMTVANGPASALTRAMKAVADQKAAA